MNTSTRWALYAAVLAGTLTALLFYGIYAGAVPSALTFPFVGAFAFGILTPMGIIALRHQIRITRIRLIDLFAQTFQISEKNNVSFEFVKGKYYVDLADGNGAGGLPSYPFSTGSDWLLLISAVPMMMFATAGTFALLAPFEAFGAKGIIGEHLYPSLLAIGGLDFSKPQYSGESIEKYYHREFVLIAAIAFAGAYIYSLRLLLRAVSAFDMNSVTFLRAFTHMVLATLLATMLWRATTQAYHFHVPGGVPPALEKTLDERVGEAAPRLQPAENAGSRSEKRADLPGMTSSPLWLLVAFAIGFVPDAGLQWLLQKARLDFKPRLAKFDKRSRTVPLTLIDGIDYFIAFRLEEANIYDVQNLATANPIMLHIETPYGIYSTIDWVAQAQLCTIVGPERFFYLKRLHIRTIFDLERALLGPDASSKYKDLIVRVLMTGDQERGAIEKEIGIRGVHHGEQPAGPAQPEAPADPPPGGSLETGGARAQPAYTTIDELVAGWMDDAFIRHLATVMVDDLHVRRLRQTWNHIVDKLGATSDAIRSKAGTS